MSDLTRDDVREILEEIIKEQSQKNTAENTDEIQSKPTSTVILYDKGGYARRYEI